jgi:phosphoribosyl-AMP cyclohydrolase
MISLKYHDGLIPVIVQDTISREILMLAYANEEALKITMETGFAHYYSRSRQKIWKKGEESGHVQRIVKIRVDCDEDCLVYEVEQKGAACHTGFPTCFYRLIDGTVIGKKVFDPQSVYKKRTIHPTG